jgi:hypothetical protein
MIPLSPQAEAQMIQPIRQAAPIKWVVMDAIGYGGLGTVVGMALALSSYSCPFGPCDGAAMSVVGGAVAGAIGGAAIGIHARRTLAKGEQLGAVHRAAVLAGAMISGTTLGAVASFSLINGDGSGTPLGSDETTFGMLTLGGTAIGAILAARSANELNNPRVTISPAIGAGRYGLDARLAF